MRIAFISTIRNFPWGGADALWTRAAEAALDRGDSVLIAVTDLVAGHPRVAGLISRGAQAVSRPRTDLPVGLADRARRRLARALQRPEPLAGALRSFRPEIVVISCAGAYDFIAERPLHGWIADTGAPLRIVTNFQREHPHLSPDDRAYIGRVFASTDAVFFVSHRNLAVTRRHLLSPLPGASLIQNPLRPAPPAAPAWPQTGRAHLATVGRIDHVKGIPLLLHALVDGIGTAADWHLNLYGIGDECDYVRATAAALGIGDRVALRGYVDDLDAIWAENHLLVSPALEDGVPMTIPEAMLRGRPVLATCVGGAEDWITDGRDGFLCPAPTVPLLNAALQRVWADRARWREMGEAASAAARARYRPDDFLRLIAPRAAESKSPGPP